jgi:DNA replication protein DnaC
MAMHALKRIGASPSDSRESSDGSPGERAPAQTDLVRVMAKAGVPRRYQDARLSDFRGRAEIVPDWSLGGYCLRGATGIGKTHLAAALLRSLVESHGSPGQLMWVVAPVLVMQLRATFRRNSNQDELDVLQPYLRAKALVLDDLGAEKQSDYSATAMYSLLAVRDGESRITIVTTNQTIEDIAYWEPRIASRLAGMATIALPDEDRRLTRKGP